ncbi:unnamed protein product [Mycena citricolor]|uniref:F-box domain-containing protein n=1 Tax=Mycena citricolor TaxID=2018698 RepID=A0AAD2HL15_9AGAR|nr:unnamed protein product [Mycena citricolor]
MIERSDTIQGCALHQTSRHHSAFAFRAHDQLANTIMARDIASAELVTLPQELIDLILDLVTDQTTLKTCAIVSRSFRGTSQKKIFASISVVPLSRSHKPKLTLNNLSQILYRSPHLAAHVHSLTLVEGTDSGSPPWMSSKYLPIVLSMLANLTHISIEASRCFDWEILPESSIIAIQTTFLLPSLTSIRFHNLEFTWGSDLIALLQCAQRAATLVFSQVYVGAGEDLTDIVVLDSRSCVTSLRLDPFSPPLMHSLAIGVNLSQLKSLHTTVDSPEMEAEVQGLLASLPSLETYHIHLTHHMSDTNFIDLSSLSRLHTLEVTLTFEFLTSPTGYDPVGWVGRILARVSQPSHVRTVILNIHVDENDLDYLARLNSLEAVILNPTSGLFSMRTLTIRLISLELDFDICGGERSIQEALPLIQARDSLQIELLGITPVFLPHISQPQSLASETRRKHPDIREAAEKSLAILRASPEQATANLASDGPQSDDLLRPVFMGCATKNAKVVAISLGSLQRLIALKAVPQSAVQLIISTMSDAMIQGVDIQLRILQTLLSLVTNFPAIHGSLLGEALLLCFKLQESKIAVVSSTAAATLRQLVMFVFDKMVDEDRRDDDPDTAGWEDVTLPDGSVKMLGPSGKDAFSVFEDLCLLANSEKPNFLKLEFLHKTFALELIESVLTNYHALFRKHTELVLLLQLHLCPLLLKALSDRPLFPLTLRCTRVVFLLLKQFSLELTTEAEIFLTLLIRIVGDDSSVEQGEVGPRPQWMRVLAMEILRGLCSDAELMRNVWARYDAQINGSTSKVFTTLVAALKRLLTEKPALLGVSTQIFGVGVQPDVGANSGYGLDVAGMAGMVATAASATVSNVVGMMGSSGGLSLQGSAMKLQCIDQLDKADAPPIPESYVYLLAVQCIVSLCEGLASFAGPLYSSIVIQRPRAAGEAVVRAPPALDLASLPTDDPSTEQLRIVSSIIESGWPALLAALSLIIATNLSDDLFVEVLASYQAMTNVSGMLGLTTPRDAFFTSLSKFAVPTRVVSSLDHSEMQAPRSAASISENLGFGSGPAPPPGLSERNLACLKVLVGSALFLAGSLGDSWFGVLEALQNADYVLTSRGTLPKNANKAAPGRNSGSSRHVLLSDLDTDSLLAAIQRLFDASKNLEDDAFKHFVGALCRLSAEMVGMQSEEEPPVLDLPETTGDDLPSPTLPRRRASGIHLPRTLRSGDFGINKLGGVALSNIHRSIYRSPDVAWDTTTRHLLATLRLPHAPQPIRVQAARVLDDILVVVPRNITNAGDLQAQVQRRTLDVLRQQVVPDYGLSGQTSITSVELRRMGLETLHQILEASGHTLVVGWETIFDMLASVCKPIPPQESTASSPPSPDMRNKPIPLGLGAPSEKSQTALVKIAFQSLTLVCDSVSALSPEHLRLCIGTLGQFGRQADTNIALTAAASLLWSVSDAIQSKRKNPDAEQEYNALWMFLLLQVLGLCTDPRPEVRDGAIQTLFRTMQLYGATLSLETWDECLWKVTFPLLDSLTGEIRRAEDPAWDESKTLALHSIGSIFHDFLANKLVELESFVKAWDVFVGHIQDTVLFDNRSISSPALRCLEKAIKASSKVSAEKSDSVTEIWERAWTMAETVGGAIVRRGGDARHSFTQESLVSFLDVIRCTRATSRALNGTEWPLERLTQLMSILKGVLTYPSSLDYRPDIDQLPPVQTIVVETISEIALEASGVPSLVMRDLSEYATLPFLAAFDGPPDPKSQTPPKRVTYIALTKRIMPLLVDLFLRFKEREEIYIDGTIEAVLSAYSIPIKLKYDCPPASKFGKDLPLWKTATSNFLRIVKECVDPIETLGPAISDEHLEAIWRQMLDVFKGGILADCSIAESFSLEIQEAEENFDLALIGALEIDVVPHLGSSRVPDALVGQLAKVLQHGSRLYESDPQSPTSSSSFEKVEFDADEEEGTAQPGTLVPRERFSYWCFDLLFLICSDTTKDQEPSRRRLAALSLPALLSRCRRVLTSYVADEKLRGNLPFPRVREDELLYTLRKLLQLQLWPGSLWAAESDDPTKYAAEQPAIDASAPPKTLVSEAVKRSTLGHLFHLYPLLCEIAAVPRKAPAAWVLTEGRASELDARELARDCLKIVTGASGFLGSHVVHQLLEKGYRVRAAARGAKADALKAVYADYGDRVEIVKITDIAHDQFPEQLAGVDAIMHLASPLPGKAEPAEMLRLAKEGTMNVIVQGEKAGVKRMVVTSSIATVVNPSNSFTDQDWNPVTREIALSAVSGMATYAASKKFSELALWEWAEKHPHVEVTTLNPPFFFGPFTKGFAIPPGDYGALSTSNIIYNLLFKDGALPNHTRYIDVRDVAAGHVGALSSPPTARVGRKRIIFSSPYGWSIRKRLEFIAEQRPGLKDRLTTREPVPQPFDILPMDFGRVEEVLGMKKSDFKTFEETTLDTVDALLEVERQWKDAGYDVEQTPPSFAT